MLAHPTGYEARRLKSFDGLTLRVPSHVGHDHVRASSDQGNRDRQRLVGGGPVSHCRDDAIGHVLDRS